MSFIGLYGCDNNNASFDSNQSQPDQADPALTTTHESQTPPKPLRASAANKTPPAQYNPADIVLTWVLPASRADGSALNVADIGGYEIAYGGINDKKVIISIDDPLTNRYKIFNLPANNYAFNISSYDINSRFSAPSVTTHVSREQFPKKN